MHNGVSLNQVYENCTFIISFRNLEYRRYRDKAGGFIRQAAVTHVWKTFFLLEISYRSNV